MTVLYPFVPYAPGCRTPWIASEYAYPSPGGSSFAPYYYTRQEVGCDKVFCDNLCQLARVGMELVTSDEDCQCDNKLRQCRELSTSSSILATLTSSAGGMGLASLLLL